MNPRLMAPLLLACLAAPGAAAMTNPHMLCTPYTGGYLGNIVCVYDHENGFTGVWVGQGIVIQGVDVHAGEGPNGLDACVSTQSQCAFWGGP